MFQSQPLQDKGRRWSTRPFYWFTSTNSPFCFLQAHKMRNMLVINHIKCLCFFLTGT